MRVIGMISGTSFDAIEAAALELELDGAMIVGELVEHVSAPYSPRLRAAIAAVLPPAATTIGEVCALDSRIGAEFADVARELAGRLWDGAADIVCSHGQTVFHWVENGHALGTLQLGQAAFIAEATGATVVTDVRSRDVAAGGHGAPLASLLDVLLLGAHPTRVRGSLNLGGIANITVVGPDSDPVAFDIGPANALIDAAVSWLTRGVDGFDDGGRRAAHGKVDERLLLHLLAEPYYATPAPKSTGKELFNLEYLLDRVEGTPDPDDLVATLTALTVETVARAVEEFAVTDLVAAGGGTRNPTLMAGLARRLPGVSIGLVDSFGIPEAAKEAVLFAVIGLLSVHGLPSTVASCTGARHESVLGAIVPGRQAITQLPASAMPTMIDLRGSHR